jgi:hypothetical protein
MIKKEPINNNFSQQENNIEDINFDTSALEPTPEEILLPSLGIYYENENQIIKQNGGKILITPLTLKHEVLLTSPRIVKSGQLLTTLLSATIKTPNVNPNALLSGDRLFLFYYLRSISYGDEYKFSTQCPSCRETFFKTIRLSSLKIKYGDKNKPEPIPIDLPISKKRIYIRFSRGYDEQTLEDQDLMEGILKLIVKIDGIPSNLQKKFLENLNLRDAAIIRKFFEENEPGIDARLSLTCPNCSYEFETILPITVDFFRASI